MLPPKTKTMSCFKCWATFLGATSSAVKVPNTQDLMVIPLNAFDVPPSVVLDLLESLVQVVSVWSVLQGWP